MDNEINKIANIATVVIVVIIVIFVILTSSGNSNSSGSRTCKSCGRSFSDSANEISIKKTGMCKNCYNNYNWGMAATGKGTAYHIDNDKECEIILLSFQEESDKDEYLALQAG